MYGLTLRWTRRSVLHMNTTAGQDFATAARKNLGIGPRSTKNAAALKRDMLAAVETACTFPKSYGPERTAIFRTAFGVVSGYRKHIDGYRVDGNTRYQIEQMTPYQFASFIGKQIDAGVTNVGEAERFYAAMR